MRYQECYQVSRTSVKVFFNFRSPYCYLVSHSLFERLAAYDVALEWRSLGGWDGRSSPDRAKVKVPLTRQDAEEVLQHALGGPDVLGENTSRTAPDS